MAISVVNKTFGVVTPANADWTTAVNIVTVATGANLTVKSVKIVDVGGDGGEVRLLLYDGTNTYQMDAVTVGELDNIDLSPLLPYHVEAGWSLQYQSKGGAGIHLTLTGILQTTV